jgi:tetratricopeptide (TPR) repeat protein
MRNSISSDPWQALPGALANERLLLRVLSRAAPARRAARLPDDAALAGFRQAAAHAADGDLAAAAACYAAALRAAPGFAQAWAALGLCLGQLGHAKAQVAACDIALRIAPDFAEALLARGAALTALHRHGEAAADYGAAARLQPASPHAWAALGRARRAAGEPEAAAAAFGTAITHALASGMEPLPSALLAAYADALRAAGDSLRQNGHPTAALRAYDDSLHLQPDHPGALCASATLLQDRGHFEAAIIRYRAALAARPDFATAWRNLGTALQALGQCEAAVTAYRAAIGLDPGDADLHSHLGAALTEAGRPEEAEACFATALTLSPDNADAHFNRGLALLKAGRFCEGWAEHEWRTRGILPPHGIGRPQWRGEPAAGQSILLHAEQGFGDTIQFIRYVPLVAARGLRIVLDVPQPLRRLAESLPGIDCLLHAGAHRPDIDLHCPLMSLPFAFDTELTSIPATTPYLAPPDDCARLWRDRVPSGEGLKVGLVWAGNPRPGEARSHAADQRRSVALATLAPLARIRGVRWFSLQKDHRDPDSERFAFTDLMPLVSDFADTAALIGTLDLVIAVDTAVAHLAGALGKPVWMLSRFDGCWRWLQGRDDTPWYPTMRLYRQEKPADWTSPVARLAADVSAVVEARQGGFAPLTPTRAWRPGPPLREDKGWGGTPQRGPTRGILGAEPLA